MPLIGSLRCLAAGAALALGAVADRAIGQEFVAHRLFVADIYRRNVFEFDRSGTGLGPLSATPIAAPGGLAFGPGGEIFVASSGAEAIIPLDALGQPAGAPISAGGLVTGAAGIAFGPNGRLYVASSGTSEVYVFAPDGTIEDVLPLPGVVAPAGLAFEPTGRLLVTGFAANLVFELHPSGEIARTLSALGLQGPVGVAVGPDARIYVSGFDSDAVFVFDPSGALDATITSPGLDAPAGLAFGPNGLLYVGALEAHRIFVFRTDGAVVQEILHPLLLGPQALAFSPARFGAKVSGVLAEPGEPRRKISERYRKDSGPVLSISLGLGQAMLLLEDGADPEDLASLLGTDRLVFAARSGFATERNAIVVAGQTPPAQEAEGRLLLNVKGKGETATGVFDLRRVRGTLGAASGSRLFLGKVSANKFLE